MSIKGPSRVSVFRQILRAARILIHICYGLLLATAARISAAVMPHQYLKFRYHCARTWLSAAISILGVKITVTGQPESGTALFVANHISWLDIVALSAVLDADFIAKREVRDWPLLGWLVQQGGTLFVRRGRAPNGARVIEETAFRLRSGRSVMLFPEGTTTDGEQVLPFKPLLLRAAILAHVPVQPVALRYEAADGHPERIAFIGETGFVVHLWRVMRMRGVCLHISFCKALSVTGAHERQLAEAAQQVITNSLGLVAKATRVTAA